MEQLMMNAIRQFRREHKFSEIRSVSVQEWSGKFGQAVDAALSRLTNERRQGNE